MGLIKKNRVQKYLPLLFITFLAIIIFRKFFFQGLIPAPLDLLVAFNFPWYSGGFKGYDPWTIYKGLLNADVIRQVMPWKILVINQFKKLSLPLWNPYNFCGNPLMANFQSAAFYPLNLIFWLFNFPFAWTVLEILQIILGVSFMYLFLRENNFSRVACLTGSVVFMLNTFMLSWLELNIIGHTLLWLPLVLFSVDKYGKTFKNRYLLLISLGLLLSILAGYPLALFYIFLVYFFYVLWNFKLTKVTFKYFISAFFSIVIASFQLLPTLEFFNNSLLGFELGRKAFKAGIIPWRHLITFLAPDYYGNHSTGNWWGQGGPGDLTPFIGVITLILVFIALSWKIKDLKVKFFSLISLLGLLIALPTPLNFLISNIKIPVLSSTSSARALILLYFSAGFLTASGLDFLLKKKISFKKVLIPLFILIVCYFGVGIKTLLIYKTTTDFLLKTNMRVGLKNLVLPIGVFGLTFLALWKYIKKPRKIFLYLALLVNLFLFIYTADKYLSFAPKKFFYPKHILFDYLKKQGYWRFHGYGTSYIQSNFQIPYSVYSPLGYDVLRISDYGELAASSYTGKLELPDNFSRADADFPEKENFYRERLFDLMGVKYITNKVDEPKSDWEPRYDLFPSDRYKMVWQKERFQLYERKSVYPRVFLVSNYLIENDKKKIIEKIYNRDIDLRDLLVLSGKIPNFKLEEGSKEAKIIDYQPNKVKVETQSEGNSLLFLSDAYYPGWSADVDGEETPVYKADYAFRAVFVPKGRHLVEFIYRPKSFYYGLKISSIGFLALIFFVIISLRRKTI